MGPLRHKVGPMFRSIILSRADQSNSTFDAGLLAESLIFYGKVAVIGHGETLTHLLSSISIPVAVELLRSKTLEFHFCNDGLGIMAQPDRTGRKLYKSCTYNLPHRSLFEEMSRSLSDAGADPRRISSIESALGRLIKPFEHCKFSHDEMTDELAKSNRVEPAIVAILSKLAPEYEQAKPIRFCLSREKDGLILDTNIDFSRLTTVSEAHKCLTPEYLISMLQHARAQILYAAQLDSELATNPTYSEIHRLAMDSIINERMRSETNISKFSDVVIGETRAIREAINSGRIHFSALLPVIESRERFRKWLDGKAPELSLIREYYLETIKDSPLEALPAKATRFVLFTLLGYAADSVFSGGIGAAAGLAVGAVDAFLIDRLTKGWRPNHFIEGELKPVLGGRPREGTASTH